MSDAINPRNRLALWYEQTPRPGLALCGVAVLLYAWALPWGFVIDDHRHVTLCRDYHEGRRDSLGLYRFLASDAENRLLRENGHLPWWVGDDVRYQHLRPLSERLLYLEFLVTGGQPAGYRVMSLALYCAGLLLVLRYLRAISADERLARWGALAYALAGAHALPVVFIAMQCDLLGLTLALAAALAAHRFVRDGGISSAIVAALLYALSLGAKESSLPVAIAPLCSYLAVRREQGVRRSKEDLCPAHPGRAGAARRGWGLTGVLALLGLGWIGAYAVGDYGSNTGIILDPIHAPGAYLAALPGRVLLLLSTTIQPVNPFVFYLRPRGAIGLYVLGAIAALALPVLAFMFARYHRGQRGVAAMALWVLAFLPLLACTIPDDRNMILPGVGVAFFVGAWLTRPAGAQPPRPLLRLPLLMFIVGQMPAGPVVSGLFRAMEQDCAAHVRGALAAMGHPPRGGDQVFFVNVSRDWHVLFSQYALDRATGESGVPGTRGVPGVRASFLSELEAPTLTRLDERTLRIEGGGQAFLDGFLGAMSTSRAQPKREGDVFDAGVFTARVERVQDGQVMTVVFRFREPLDSPNYTFLECRRDGPPRRVAMPRVGEAVQCSW